MTRRQMTTITTGALIMIEQQLNILESYKNFNGPDGNSPTTEISPESYPTSASTIPDIEDINNDNTLNEYERYYQYKVSLKKGDMQLGTKLYHGY